MKTKKLSLIALTGAVSVMLLSCKKEDNAPTSTSEATKGTISGYVYADLDETSNGLEFAPNGTNVIASIITNGKTYNYNGVVTDGKYTISIPVGRDAKTYTIVSDKFSANQTIKDGTKKLKFYSVNTQTISLYASQTVNADIIYSVSDNNPTSLQQTVTFQGKLNYDSDLTDAANPLTNVPDGTKIYFGTKYVTTVSNGTYQFTIATTVNTSVSETLTFDDFKANQKTASGTSEKVFRLSQKNVSGAAGTINNLSDYTFLAQ